MSATRAPARIRCEDGKRCKQPATVFAMAHHYCAGHAPKGSPECTHSLAPSGRCAYCGAITSTEGP